MTFGFSRDDAEGKFLGSYVEDRVLDEDPFKVLDRPGVGLLAKIACEAGKSTRPSLELGICGEHGGDPSSIEFFDTIGLDYVSCSPHRVPVARLAAAQATLRSRGLSNRGNPTV
jgi:pyruvate,orthophosphate dikinase